MNRKSTNFFFHTEMYFLSTFCLLLCIPFHLKARHKKLSKVKSSYNVSRLFRTIDTYTARVLMDESIQRINEKDSLGEANSLDASNLNKDEFSSHLLPLWVVMVSSAVLPGFGQIFNAIEGNYWAYLKAPIAMGGVGFFLYMIIDKNNQMISENRLYLDKYENYKQQLQAYNDAVAEFKQINDREPQSDEISVQRPSTFDDTNRQKRDVLREEREGLIMGLVLIYALSLIDVYVDFKLKTFEVKEVREAKIMSPQPSHVRLLSLKFRI